jgi:hypothetical protein
MSEPSAVVTTVWTVLPDNELTTKKIQCTEKHPLPPQKKIKTLVPNRGFWDVRLNFPLTGNVPSCEPLTNTLTAASWRGAIAHRLSTCGLGNLKCSLFPASNTVHRCKYESLKVMKIYTAFCLRNCFIQDGSKVTWHPMFEYRNTIHAIILSLRGSICKLVEKTWHFEHLK